MLNEIWSDIQTRIIASMSFITALALNSTFQHLFENTPFLKKSGPWIYALLITLIGITITYLLQRKAKEEEKDEPS